MQYKITIRLSDGSSQEFHPYEKSEIEEMKTKGVSFINSNSGDYIFNPSHIIYIKIEELVEGEDEE